MTSAGLFEVGINGLAALDTRRPAKTDGPRPQVGLFYAEHSAAAEDCDTWSFMLSNLQYSSVDFTEGQLKAERSVLMRQIKTIFPQ